jgi:hypothetical protein
MAKISAHGSHKVTERSFDVYSGTHSDFLGSVTRYIFVLRSDGAILRATSWPEAETSYDRKRTGYSLIAKIKPGRDRLEAFNRFVDRRESTAQ